MFMALLYLHWYVGNKHAYLGGLVLNYKGIVPLWKTVL